MAAPTPAPTPGGGLSIIAPLFSPTPTPPTGMSGSATPVAASAMSFTFSGSSGAGPVPPTATPAAAAAEAAAPNVVNFICQRCKLPMRLDPSMMELNVDRFNSLAVVESDPVPGSPLADAPLRRVVNRGQEELIEPPLAFADAADAKAAEADSFVLVGKPVPDAVKSRAPHRIKVAAKLFDLLTTQSHMDHPVCEDCNMQLQADVKEAIKEADAERAAYQSFLASDAARSPDPEYVRKMETEISELQAEEARLLAELERLATEQEQLQVTAVELEKEATEVRALEEQYWRDLNAFQEDQEAFQNERDSLVRKHSYTTEQLTRLRKTSVYDEVFRIWHDGPFGTINNCRLGRLPGMLVDWTEINAAWGQALLLLHTLARKLHFEFSTYKLIPAGSFSRVERITEPRASYELFGSGEYRAFFRNSQKFDNAMVGFLDCLAQLIGYARNADRTIKIPFEISGDRVGEFSIKYNLDMNWTRALKYTLINLKWLMAWVSRHTA